MTDLSLLAQNALFKGIENIWGALNCLGYTRRSYEKNETVFAAGDEIKSIGILTSGAVNIIDTDALGRQTIIAYIGAPDNFAEAFVCAGIERSPVTVTAAEDCEVLFVPLNRIINTCGNQCEHHRRLIENLLCVLADKNIVLSKKINIISRRTVRDKVWTYLLWEYGKQRVNPFTVALNRSDMADFLCVERSAMSRELSRMREDGIIDYWRSSFKLLQYDKIIN